MNINSTFIVDDLQFIMGIYHDESFEEQDIRLPMIPPLREEIEDVFDDQLLSTKKSGFQKF